MVLTDITREEEKRMKKNEKQIIISLGVAIAVVAIALIAMMITSGSSDNGQSSSLKDAVQQESNGNGSDDVSESDAGELDLMNSLQRSMTTDDLFEIIKKAY